MILYGIFSIFILRFWYYIFDDRIFSLCFTFVTRRGQGFCHDSFFCILRAMKTRSQNLPHDLMLRAMEILVVVLWGQNFGEPWLFAELLGKLMLITFFFLASKQRIFHNQIRFRFSNSSNNFIWLSSFVVVGFEIVATENIIHEW